MRPKKGGPFNKYWKGKVEARNRRRKEEVRKKAAGETITTGPLLSKHGEVLVDREKFPTLWRALQSAAAPIREHREKWQRSMQLAAEGKFGEAEALRAELLGVEPKAVTKDYPEVPVEKKGSVEELLSKLKRTKDKTEAGRIRQELRKLGHRGGLRGRNK